MDGGQRMTETELVYFETWNGLHAPGRSLTMLAQKLDVSTAAVSKRMKSMAKRGYLTDCYELTPLGQEYYDWYRLWYRGIHAWYRSMGIVEADARSATLHLLAGASVPVLDMMMNQGVICMLRGNQRLARREIENGILQFKNVELADILPEGRYSICVSFRRIGEDSPSMAEDAFDPTRLMVIENGKSEIRLRRQMLIHESLTGHYDVRGQMKSMEYRSGSRMKKPKIIDDSVGIAMRNLTWKVREGNSSGLMGELEVTFTCTAGAHMPKSSALMCVSLRKPSESL